MYTETTRKLTPHADVRVLQMQQGPEGKVGVHDHGPGQGAERRRPPTLAARAAADDHRVALVKH